MDFFLFMLFSLHLLEKRADYIVILPKCQAEGLLFQQLDFAFVRAEHVERVDHAAAL